MALACYYGAKRRQSSTILELDGFIAGVAMPQHEHVQFKQAPLWHFHFNG